MHPPEVTLGREGDPLRPGRPALPTLVLQQLSAQRLDMLQNFVGVLLLQCQLFPNLLIYICLQLN